MFDIFRSLTGTKPRLTTTVTRARLQATRWPAVLYAIGDVHGCLAELEQLEGMIADDARQFEGERWLVMLGDYIDRGPHSAQVVAHLMAPPPSGFRRISLAGNHEQMLLEFLADPVANAHWLEFGMLDSARSYGVRQGITRARRVREIAASLRSLIPEPHLEFLRNLPISLSLPGHHFVHAGLRPGIAMEAQIDEDLLWIRTPFIEEAGDATDVVVHGHTPVAEPDVRPWRIGIDTAAFASGRLTAVRLSPGVAPTFLCTGR